MEDGRWVSNKEACAFYGVSGNTLRQWANDNSIVYKRNPSHQRSYFIPCQSNDLHAKSTSKFEAPKSYVYCRVSSRKQQDDLQRQCDFLTNKFPNHTLIKDIGSGLNYKRPGLLTMICLMHFRLESSNVDVSDDVSKKI
jgi:predicted site-specific integrase-resolvase